MDVVLLHNENAGDEEWSRKQLVKLVRSAGFKPLYFEIDEALARPGVLARGKFVIVAGGDGSIRKVALKLLGRGIPLAPLPLGTANNIAHSLELPDKPAKIVARWDRPRRLPFDVGLARGPWGRRAFVEGIGCGLISRIISVLRMVDQVSAKSFKRAKHKLLRDACVATALAHELPPLRGRVAIDGRALAGEFLMLEILNIRRAGPAIELAPRASPSDGRFDVVALTARRRRQLLDALEDRLAHVKHPRNLASHRARRVRFTPAADCELRIDDDTVTLPAGATVEVTIEPGALEMLLPR